ncbi:NAD(P)-dependent dehydrogenase (short-subunit alcohol dehydrogenase family) [Actinomadura rupiterrae]|nr:NAD(P)-dependent dehydrogenase (short-subunit alcohol dehydrogenase family) [Actinomadura rupiterrae]
MLCNNAGVFNGCQIWSRPARDFAWALQVNFWGVLHGIQAFVPRMIEGGDEGHIVTTSSVAGLFAAPFSGPYSVSKFAAYAATECLGHELVVSGSRLRASVLCPGGVATPHPSVGTQPSGVGADRAVRRPGVRRAGHRGHRRGRDRAGSGRGAGRGRRPDAAVPGADA